MVPRKNFKSRGKYGFAKDLSPQYTWRRRVSAETQPSAIAITDIMQNLAKDGFGIVLTVERSIVFFKKLPSSLTEEELQKYDLTPVSYRGAFVERAHKTVISKDQFKFFLKSHQMRMISLPFTLSHVRRMADIESISPYKWNYFGLVMNM